VSEAALRAAVAEVVRGLAEPGWIDRVDPQLVQQLLGAAVVLYAGKVELDRGVAPFAGAGPVPTATDVCQTSTRMLDAVSVEVFELALWKSWGHSAGETGNDESLESEP
jgi:hypothetical protein